MTHNDKRYRQAGLLEYIRKVLVVHCHKCLFWKTCKGKKRVCRKLQTSKSLKSISTEQLERARTKLNLYDNVISSAIFGYNDPRQLPLVHFYMISRDAELFINRQKNPFRFHQDITTISDRASEYLSREGIKAKISVSLFADPEYDDWIEPKIRIEVPKDELAKTYGIYNGLLSYCLQGIRRRTMKQLFVTIESV